MKKRVTIGILGSVLDGGYSPKRWKRWRPTVSLFQHENLLIDKLELLYLRENSKLLKTVLEDIRQVSPETQITTHEIQLTNAWDFEEVYGVLYEFARQYRFDTDKEEYLVHITTGTHVFQICSFILTESRHFPANLIQTGPPGKKRNSRESPGEYSIIDLDLSKYDSIAMRFHEELKDDISFLKLGIETRNKQFNHLIEQIEYVAQNSGEPILLTGPTGAGKSRLAERIYQLKKTKNRVTGKFACLNCATLKGDAAMSSLFGHKKGSFTGALKDRDGLLKTADNGILFLDEIGELGLDEQSMLLRAIEEKCFLPLGSDQEGSSDFQLICGTNRDLYQDIVQGRFREDLYARINLWTFEMPGLKERPEDIEPNLSYELDRYFEKNGRRITFNKEARTRFLSFAESPGAIWSGNFRDLNGALVRMSTLAKSGRITDEVVIPEISRLKQSWKRLTPDHDLELISEFMTEEEAEKLDLFDRIQLAGVLKVCRESKTISDAGRTLYAKSRVKKRNRNDADRLKKYLGKFNISFPN